MEDRKEIEKAKKECKIAIKCIRSDLRYEDTEDNFLFAESVETLLQYIEQLEQENKQYKEFIFVTNGKDIENITATKYVQIRQEGYIEGKIEEQNKSIKHINKLNKMIDEILVEYELHDRYNLKEFCDEEIRKNKCIENCLECIKQYFEKKVDEN